ncbi:hypothetical protein NSB31_29300 [Bacillus cereus]|uniref:FtsB family cell division protein n=1 Tax=Bacillota TaxID=1239 RepID=UPI00214A76B0|nr:MULTISPECIES: hypothetical protein [Bacillota]MCR1952089.1 hypothetical protein [Clostridium sp. DSM 100503]MCR2013760.1 hypothetical protein [Bacillus cereus]
MAMITLTEEQKEKFNKYFPEQYQRNVAMSIFASIKYWQDKEVGFLRFSLDKLYVKYKNKFFLTLSNFKKIANKLVSLGLLKTTNKGRLKFYGTYDCKSDNEVREENKRLREENDTLNEEVERLKKELEDFKREVREKLHSVSKDEVIEKKSEINEFEKEVISQDVVIETAYSMMDELGIEKGSTPFMQIIESLYAKTDKEAIHKKGFVNYIKKVIHNKVHNQSKFKEMLRNERRKPTTFMIKAEEQKYIKLERKLLGWD